MKTTLLFALLLICTGAALAEDSIPTSRAAWILEQADVHSFADAAPQAEIGGDIGGSYGYDQGTGTGVLKPMILSALMPGLGEATMGYRRGYLMMAVDIASWVSVKHYHNKGGELKEEYFAYADAHWSEDRLASAFGGDENDFVGTFYYKDVHDYTELSLWVSAEDDRREYYENLGKWDQFVFGWDDFSDPRNSVGVDATTVHLKDNEYGVSDNRIAYRAMRKDANNQFDNRDRLVYMNMFTRIFSMFQVAYLSGVFSDGQARAMSIGDHDVVVLAEPRGFTGGRLGFAISY